MLEKNAKEIQHEINLNFPHLCVQSPTTDAKSLSCCNLFFYCHIRHFWGYTIILTHSIPIKLFYEAIEYFWDSST